MKQIEHPNSCEPNQRNSSSVNDPAFFTKLKTPDGEFEMMMFNDLPHYPKEDFLAYSPEFNEWILTIPKNTPVICLS